MKPCIYTSTRVTAEPGLLRTRQTIHGLEVEQTLPTSTLSPTFSCELPASEAAGLELVDFSDAPLAAFDGEALVVGGTRMSAVRAEPFPFYQVRLRDLPRVSAVRREVEKALQRPFFSRSWGVLLTPERAAVVAALMSRWSPQAFALGDAADGVLLKGGMFSVLFYLSSEEFDL